MKIVFLEKNIDTDRLILIFPGWSCGKELHAGFSMKGWDLAITADYHDPTLNTETLKNYSTIYLFAWSLGVYMASITDFGQHITAAFALNGTETPVDDSYGIPCEIFRKTADNLTPSSLLKFRRRMAGSADIFRRLFDRCFSKAETDLLQHQLHLIYNWQKEKERYKLPWKKVYISEKDAIFPPSNLKNFWNTQNIEGNIEIIPINEAHYFPLERIIRMAIPDSEIVSKKFSEAKSTYNSQAIAQQQLAESLRNLLTKFGMQKDLEIAEIGPGTGLFTKELISGFVPRQLDLVDISDVHPEINDIPTTFCQHDAEKWIALPGKSYDAIVSSATVQWFVNLELFIKNVSNRLNDDGIFGFSTFMPGNLEELNSLRPSPLHYHSEDEIKSWLSRYFDNIQISDSVFKLEFDSPSSLLRHIRETGVAGSAPGAPIPLSKIRNIKTLTFRCACFAGTKRPITKK